MKLRSTVATAAAAAVAALAMGAAPASAATTAPAAKAHPALSIRVSTTNAGYDQWVAVTAHLGRTATNHTVSIDEGNSVIKSGRVDRNGNLTVWARLTHDATFVAKYAGDSRDWATSRGVRVQDAAYAFGEMVNGAYTSGGYTYYHHNQNPTLATVVAPNKAGEYVSMHVQQLVNGSWKNVRLRSVWFRLDSHSVAEVYLSGVPANTTLREAMAFGGDTTNSASNLTWHYAKVVA